VNAERPPTLFVVSDGRGETGAAVLQAALVQFRDQRHTIVRKANVRTAARIEEIVAAAAGTHGIVLYTLVADETRRAMQEAAARRAVPVVDVLGPVLSALHDLFKRAPEAEPGRCRVTTIPPERTCEPLGLSRSSAAVSQPSAASRGRSSASGWRPRVRPSER